MLTDLSPIRRNSLLVRYWYESDAGCWRLLVRDAATNHETLFATFPEFVVHLATLMAVPNSEKLPAASDDHN
jgi:subtilisin-like proprotein convertase family protein